MPHFFEGPPEKAVGRFPDQQAISRLGWSLFAMALSVQLAGPPLLWLLRRLFPVLAQAEWYSPLASILLPMVIGYPIFFLLIRRLPAAAPAQRHSMRPKQFLMALTTAFGLSYLTNLFTQLFADWFAQETGYTPQNPLLGLDNRLPAPVLLFLTVAAAPILEELVFRRAVLNRLRGWGEEFGVISSALLFSLYHGNLSQLVYAFAVGLVLGYVAIRYSVRYSMALHICLNLPSALILSFLDLSLLSEAAASPAALLSSPSGELLMLMAVSLLLSVFMFATIVGALVILATNRQRLRLSRGGSGMPERVKYRLFFFSTGIALFISMHVLLVALSLFF